MCMSPGPIEMITSFFLRTFHLHHLNGGRKKEGQETLTPRPDNQRAYLGDTALSSLVVGKQAIDSVDHTFIGEPQEEGMMQQISSFPLLQNKGYRIQ